ncbi:uncharacterized protein LOC121731679 [Aricia agestis]|uniref:uncharacterized protein LOC121731679 n=1 Tax=Aricia agestis TaxID=91739 RepID=UPI001C2035E5|nr:uncharacterized protein LOC121731679 [Aricia agestis]
MFRSLLKWNSNKKNEANKQQESYLYVLMLGIFQDAIFWKKWWFSLFFFMCFNLLFSVIVYREVNLFEFTIVCALMVLILDAFEMWLKYKHRTSCLKRLGSQDINRINNIYKSMCNFSEKVIRDFLFVRNINPTKAFLLLQISFSIIFLIGNYCNGYILTYGICTLLYFVPKLLPHAMKILKRIQQNAESDVELEGLIPEASDENLHLLAFESDIKLTPDDRQSLDLWKPEDLPLEEISDDSSDNSSSLVTNLSMDKINSLTKDVEATDSSEDEYMPHQGQPPEVTPSSMEIHPSSTWSNTAYNMFSNIGGAVAKMVYNPAQNKERRRMASAGSSDGFEIIDKNDVIQ